MNFQINQNCDFSQIDLSIPSGKTDCSPVVSKKQIMEGFTGIFINAPEKIALKDAVEIKVCMLSIMNSSDADKYGGSEQIILKNTTTNKVYEGNFYNEDHEEPPPEQDIGSAEDLNIISESYFNFNLHTYVDFDANPGTYQLHIKMGPINSNSLQFEIVDN